MSGLISSSLLSKFKYYRDFLQINLYNLTVLPRNESSKQHLLKSKSRMVLNSIISGQKKSCLPRHPLVKIRVKLWNKLLKKLFGCIWYSKLHNLRRNRGFWGFLEPIIETFRKYIGYIWYSKLHNFSFSWIQGWAFWNLKSFCIIPAGNTYQ